MFSGPVDDQLAIRARFDAYADAVTRKDLDAYLECWTADGARRGQGGEATGTPELTAHWHEIWKALSQMVFVTQIGAIEVVGDAATTRSYCLELLRFRDGTKHRVVGEYHDRLVRIGGRWLFSERRYAVLLDDA